MESNCCGALPIGETYDNLGLCSECREHAVFKETRCGLAMAELDD